MKARLSRWWTSHSPRERAILAAAVLIAGVALYGTFVHMATRARAQLAARVDTLRVQAAQMDQYAHELERARAAPPAPAPASNVRAAIEQHAGERGLSGALARIDAPDPGQATVQFGTLVFADWLGLVNALGTQGIRVASCRIEAASAPGTVNATATLVRPSQ